MRINLSRAKTPRGAANMLARRLRRYAEKWDYPPSIIVRSPGESQYGGWEVGWEEGPEEWAMRYQIDTAPTVHYELIYSFALEFWPN